MKIKKIIISLFVLVFVAFAQLSSVFAQKVTLAEESTSNISNLGQSGMTLEEKIVLMAYRKMNILERV